MGGISHVVTHPALSAFLAEWRAPIDVSGGSRVGFDEHEMRIVHAAQTFVAANPPGRVRDYLIQWLRPQMKWSGAWCYANQVLRIVTKADVHPSVDRAHRLAELAPSTDDIHAFAIDIADDPPEVRYQAMLVLARVAIVASEQLICWFGPSN